MTIEQITYDFSDHKEYFRTFFVRIVKLIIISKLNCIESNNSSLNYFYQIVNHIEGCESHKKRYGKPMMFTKFLGYEFTYHTISVSIKVVDKYTLDILLQSVFSDFIKVFDKLSIDTEVNNIRWNLPLDKEKEKKDSNNAAADDNNTDDENDILGTFSLLDSFIESLYFLILLSPNDPNGLIGKNLELRDVSVNRKSINVEFLVNENPIIMIFAPKKRKNKIDVVMDDDNKIGNTIKEIMYQKKPF